MPFIFNKGRRFMFEQGIYSVCVRACVHACMLENVCVCVGLCMLIRYEPLGHAHTCHVSHSKSEKNPVRHNHSPNSYDCRREMLIPDN